MSDVKRAAKNIAWSLVSRGMTSMYWDDAGSALIVRCEARHKGTTQLRADIIEAITEDDYHADLYSLGTGSVAVVSATIEQRIDRASRWLLDGRTIVRTYSPLDSATMLAVARKRYCPDEYTVRFEGVHVVVTARGGV